MREVLDFTPAAYTHTSYVSDRVSPSASLPMRISAARVRGSMLVTVPSMNAARGLDARIGSVIDLYSTVPTDEAASIGVKMKKFRGEITSVR